MYLMFFHRIRKSEESLNHSFCDVNFHQVLMVCNFLQKNVKLIGMEAKLVALLGRNPDFGLLFVSTASTTALGTW